MKRILLASLFLLIVLSGTDTQHHTYVSNNDNKTPDITAIPPTFITLQEIRDCDPSKEFPQRNPLPYFADAFQIQSSCDVYDKDHVAWVIFIFYELWERDFLDPGRQVQTALMKLEIEWGPEPLKVENVYDIDGNFIEKAEVSGLMRNSHSIWVLSEDYISETSLVHELVHIALRHSCGSADPDHEGDEYPCWTEKHSEFIDSVNLELLTTYGL